MKNNFLIILFSLSISACHKDEIPIAPHVASDATEVQVAMGQTYKDQLFYSLKDNAIISSNDKKNWNLGFESAANGWHIILNSANGMAVHRSDLNFDEINDVTGLTWDHWDTHTGNLDSTAIGNWQLENKIYIIDLGLDDLGSHLGYYKLKIESVNANAYLISFGEISELIPQQQTITKNTANLFTFYSFQNGVVSIAPPNETWDLVFTQYTHLFTEPEEAYVVTGVLLNPFTTKATTITTKSFNAITYSDAIALNYSSNLDVIGYSWKVYDFNLSIYTVDPTITYLVKTSEGLYYKLHFIDFYNALGIKGYPKFEMQLL